MLAGTYDLLCSDHIGSLQKSITQVSRPALWHYDRASPCPLPVLLNGVIEIKLPSTTWAEKYSDLISLSTGIIQHVLGTVDFLSTLLRSARGSRCAHFRKVKPDFDSGILHRLGLNRRSRGSRSIQSRISLNPSTPRPTMMIAIKESRHRIISRGAGTRTAYPFRLMQSTAGVKKPESHTAV